MHSSRLSQVLEDKIIASPSKLKTKYALYRKSPPSFLPIQTPPDTPLSETPPNQNTVFRFADTKQTSSSLAVQRISHPYAQHPYDFPVSPREHSPNYSESSPITRYFSPLSSPTATSPRPTSLLKRALNNSPFFSSVSASSYPEKKVVESAPKLAPFAGNVVSSPYEYVPEHTPDTSPYDLASPLVPEPRTPAIASQNLSVHDQRGLGITEEQEKGAKSKQRRRPSLLFSIPEEDMQSQSSKSFNRLSSANSTTTWRNSWNTACGDIGLAITTVSAPPASGGLGDDGHLGDDGEEGSRACLMGLLEELEEWGCEWVDNADAPIHR